MKSKFIKKALTLVLLIALSLTLTLTPAFAAVNYSVEIADMRDGIVTVIGETDVEQEGSLNVFVLNPDYTIEDALTPAAIQQQGEAVVEADGNFSFTFPLNIDADFERGTFTFYVGGNGYGAPRMKEFTYTSFTKRLEYAKGVYEKAKADDEELSEYLATAADLLAVHEAFYVVDANDVAEELVQYYAETEVDFGEELPAGEEKDAAELLAIETVVKDINRLSVLQAFRDSKSEVLFDSKGGIKVDSIIGLSAKVEEKTSLMGELSTLTSEGIANTNKALLGVDIADADELAKLYAKNIILYGIKNNKQMGYSYIEDFLTAKNTEYAGYSIPKYLDLSDKADTNAAIVGIKSTLTLENLASKVEEKAGIEEEKPQSGSSVSAGGGGSGGSGGGGYTALQPIDKPVVQEPTPIAPENDDVFTDIASYGWAKEAIEALWQKGILSGNGDGTFEPAGKLTREQAVKIVCLALGMEEGENAGEAFADEIDGAWYASYLAIARANGIAGGQGDNMFGIGKSISRQDFAVMLYRALKAEGAEVSLNFADASDVADYAKQAVSYFVSKGIINGYNDGTFRPTATISRAEASKLVYGLIK